jgi:5-formyltetrahydrofolate cyclo-ligase
MGSAPSVVVDKRALRRAMSDRRAALAPDERAQRSLAAVEHLLAMPELAGAATIAGFVATAAEIDPREALAAAERRGAAVVYPRVHADRQPRLRFHRMAGAELQPGAYGLLEPPPDCPEVAAEAIDLFLVPGLAFDVAGGRLGHGGGYYDEVGALARGWLVGVGFDFQLVDRCPTGPDDVAVDYVVTDARVVLCQAHRTEGVS